MSTNNDPDNIINDIEALKRTRSITAQEIRKYERSPELAAPNLLEELKGDLAFCDNRIAYLEGR